MAFRDYISTGLRLERRPAPHEKIPGLSHFEQEKIHAQAGVQARWIGVVDPKGSPYYQSDYLGVSEKAKPGDEKLIREWVKDIHQAGMAAMSWFPMCHSKSATEKHPEWRQIFLTKELVSHEESLKRFGGDWTCINSPYGDALISFTIEAIKKFDLDGFWFDGTALSPIWLSPVPPSCVCSWCRKKFKAQEKLNLPEKVDWADSAFRKWVAWRYRTFSEYIGRLAGEVHRTYPHIRIAINHYHRKDSFWQSGMPLNPYPADIVCGSEAKDSPFIGAFTTRLMRAYGKSANEVWMPLQNKGRFSPSSKDPAYRDVHHALACVTAGGIPSFGTDAAPTQTQSTLKKIAAQLNPRSAFVGGDSVKYTALHISQQSETFIFSRATRKHGEGDAGCYWKTMVGWHHLLAETQSLNDIIFDDHIKPGVLSEYPVVIAPLSIAFKDEQVYAFEEYVCRGGVLVVEPSFGFCDEWGDKADPRRVKAILGRPAAKPPEPGNYQPAKSELIIRSLGLGKVIVLSGNVGACFEYLHQRELAEDVAAVLKKVAPPAIEIDGSPNIHVGLYRQKNGELLLHLHNFLAWSDYSSFAGVMRLENKPRIIKNLRVHLRGWHVKTVHSVLNPIFKPLELKVKKDSVEFIIPNLLWGDILKIETVLSDGC